MGCSQSGQTPQKGKKGGTAAPVTPPAVVGDVGDVEVYGVGPSMNSMGAVMLAVDTKCGKLVPTMPGDATNTSEFLKINPFHAIPAIKDGSFCCAESNAILRYLSMKYAPAMYVKLEKQRRAEIDWSMDHFSSVIYPDVVTCIYPLLGFAQALAEADQEAAGKKATENLAKFAEVFLKEKFIGGSVLSIADYKVAPFFFAFAHKQVGEKSKVEVPERILQFNFDFKAVSPSGYKMLSDAGGYSIKEMLDPKTSGSETKPPNEVSANTLKEVKEGFKTPVGQGLTDWLSSFTTGGSGKVKIHGVTASMNCLGPLLLAKHKSVGDLEVCMPGEQSQSESYKNMVPFGGVPGLEDGKWSMGESSAILRYLAREYAEDLYPQDAEKRGMIDWAMDRFTSGMYNDAVATIYVALGFATAPEKEEDLKAAGEKASKGLDEFAEFFLKKSGKFVAGGQLSIVDFKVAPFFYAYAHTRVQRLCGVKVPELISQFNLDFAKACPESKLFQQADGGYSLEEMLNAKDAAELSDKEVVNTEMQKAMETEAQKTVVEMEPSTDNPKNTGCFLCS